MFIGCSSGLAWLAWACRVPAIVIGGFTEPFNEPPEMVRVCNPHVCHGCWNDTRFKFDVSDPLWCPRHRNDRRHLECATCISADSVIRAIDRIHGFAQVIPEARP
jgi:autotransporter strand-loop-strand O-heptosyltransferase